MNISSIQKAISGESLDGWLFFNFLHRDPLSDRILGISSSAMNSRAWYYMVPAAGEPVKISHAVEPDSLGGLPGKTEIYSSRDGLLSILRGFRGNWGAQFSAELTTVSTLDYGTALMLEGAGLSLKSSAGLIQRLTGLLDEKAIASHEEAASHLYQIVDLVWNRISAHFKDESLADLTETEVQRWILDEFKTRGMITEHMPVVASGPSSANPHYAAEDGSCPVLKDSILQLDLWAKLDKPGSIYADISWLGYTGLRAPEEAVLMFNAVRDARDSCAAFIKRSLESGETITGADADAETRKLLISRGYGGLIKHRTGHGIDTEVHGSGAGLDSVEFPDRRPLLEGSCFSIEPGLYSKDYGMRTEIDGYIKNGTFRISGPGPQREILTIN